MCRTNQFGKFHRHRKGNRTRFFVQYFDVIALERFFYKFAIPLRTKVSEKWLICLSVSDTGIAK